MMRMRVMCETILGGWYCSRKSRSISGRSGGAGKRRGEACDLHRGRPAGVSYSHDRRPHGPSSTSSEFLSYHHQIPRVSRIPHPVKSGNRQTQIWITRILVSRSIVLKDRVYSICV